jgi:hypothetical protein
MFSRSEEKRCLSVHAPESVTRRLAQTLGNVYMLGKAHPTPQLVTIVILLLLLS